MRNLKRLFILVIASLGLLAVWPPGAASVQAADPEALLRLHYQAVNRGDIPAGLASFTDDAVLIRGACSAALPCVGKTEIQRRLQLELVSRASFGVLSSNVLGDTVTARVEFWNINIPPIGIQRVIYNATITFQGDKIARMVHAPDLSDPQSALFSNFDRVSGTFAAHVAGIQRGDVTATMAFFTDGAVFEGGPLCSPVPCTGKQAIQKEIEREIADHTRFTPVPGSLRVSGDIRTARYEIRSDSIGAAGVERIIVDFTTEVKGDRITSQRMVLDPNDPQTAAYLAASPGAAPAQPAALPRTGTGGLHSEGVNP